ncbi:putative Receptor-kinase [Quillaja saponaria]|uniref:non-specific serine/threonine protein kinase n=1 Tax=Quillaja saponaria TaxID=32244 RepID=A0AAD7L9Q2_QUISA|nr:putative Receptor-kinase [Quillaja saponaria]
MKPLTPILCLFWSSYLHMILLFSVSLLTLEHKNTACALGNETDQLALLKFKESLAIDPYNILSSWNRSTYFCNWHGITCGPKDQRVTDLDLQGYHLNGVISPYIGNLTFLRYINLQNNSLFGEIPPEVGHLFQLQQLYLSNNTLAGEIPANLTGCSELRILSLSGNKLVGKIPMEISSLVKLEEVYISVNNLTGEIPAFIGNLTSLRVLSLGVNNLEGNIPEEIGHLRNLSHISVAANKLSGMLPSSLFNMSSLTFFSAGVNQLNGSLPANMGLTLPNLQQFGIGINGFTGPIPVSISNASRLQLFNIPRNQFVGQVPNDLGNLKELWSLAVGRNLLGSNSSNDWDFLTSLANCSKLKVLDLNLNNFGGPLPNSIANLSAQLTQLYIGGNQISGTIPSGLGNLINLIGLDLEYNHFTGMIPTSFGNFEKMQVLTLNVNKLTGQIPSSIGNLGQLFLLDLSQNMLEGRIPPSLGYCKNLQSLAISENNFTGPIPSQVIGLSSLSLLLNLSHNSLSGSLPAEVGNLKSINSLDISENDLSGEIPVTIGNCMNLESLNLQGNSFDGVIPSSLVSLKGSLRHLDLSRNNLSGSIPEGITDFPVLEYLNVSFNMLNGEVPTEGIFQNSSAVSMAGNSKLCGGVTELHLPPCPIEVMKHRKNHALKLTVILVSVSFLLLLSACVAFYWMRKTNRKSSPTSSTIDQLPKISYQSLHQATNGFSLSNLIGSGNFGFVYEGTLESEETAVAIKVLNLQKKGAHKSFISECNALRNIRHRNLVKILTCCSSTDYSNNDFRALVFEYMTSGSLEKWLHPETESEHQPRTLDLLQRLNIVVDVASAVHYLHDQCEQPVIHCDLKPSNVLLDNDMIAHVGDFGLARLLSTINGISHKQTSTIGIKGTIGYAPPEYGMGGEVSTQGDVYSFGILVLEILTGRRPTDEMFKDGLNLHNHVKNAFPQKMLHIVDPTLFPKGLEHTAAAEENEKDGDLTERGEQNINTNTNSLSQMHPNVMKCLFSLFRIGLACSAESPKERMSIGEVTADVSSIKRAFLAVGLRDDSMYHNFENPAVQDF